MLQIEYEDTVIIELVHKRSSYSANVDTVLFCVPSQYQDLKFLANGSQGTVVCTAFNAMDRELVAIKKIPNLYSNATKAKETYRELKLLKTVNHKNIIRLVDAFVTSQSDLTHHQSSSLRHGALLEKESSSRSSFVRSFFGTSRIRSSKIRSESLSNLSSSDTSPITTSNSGNQSTIDSSTPVAIYPEDLYLVMELVDMTLNHLVRTELSHEQLSYLIYQILCAVKYLNNMSIIHRDLKPSNIGLKADGTVLLLDFGLARKESEFAMTPYKQTLYYRSPEILLGLGSYSCAVDVWSIGCIMGELITGEILFPGEGTIDQWEKIVSLIGTPDNDFIDKLPDGSRDYIRKRPCAGLDFVTTFPDSSFTSDDGDETKNHELSCQARDLLFQMLKIDPSKRITIDDALHHPYIATWLDKRDFQEQCQSKINNSIDKQFDSIDEWRNLINKELDQFKMQPNT